MKLKDAEYVSDAAQWEAQGTGRFGITGNLVGDDDEALRQEGFDQMWAPLTERIIKTIRDGRSYVVNVRSGAERVKWQGEVGKWILLITMDLVLVNHEQAEVGESVVQVDQPLDPEVMVHECGGMMFARRPWGWERTR